jgi:hypothetical protein
MDIISATKVYSTDEPDKYTVSIVLKDGQSISVPCTPANRHYAEIMRQVEAGTLTIQEAE